MMTLALTHAVGETERVALTLTEGVSLCTLVDDTEPVEEGTTGVADAVNDMHTVVVVSGVAVVLKLLGDGDVVKLLLPVDDALPPLTEMVVHGEGECVADVVREALGLTEATADAV